MLKIKGVKVVDRAIHNYYIIFLVLVKCDIIFIKTILTFSNLY